jgi:phosphohistidine phosphatase SixA
LFHGREFIISNLLNRKAKFQVGYLYFVNSVIMNKIIFLLLLIICSSCTTTYYIVRHAEKEAAAPNMTSDVALSDVGKQRAEALKSELGNKKIKQIFSTNTVRTKATAQPLSDLLGLPIQVYEAKDTTFVTKLKSGEKGNVLIVGHSNTVDDLVNQFLNRKQLSDLPDTQYGDIFIIKRKGNNYSYTTGHFGN